MRETKNDHSQNAKQNDEYMFDNIFDGMTNESRELFNRALAEGLFSKICKLEEEAEDIVMPPPSSRHKRRMNRLFREIAGGTFLPFPEEDNLCEKTL